MERRRMRRKPSFGKRMMVTMLSLVMLLSLFSPGLLAGAEETVADTSAEQLVDAQNPDAQNTGTQAAEEETGDTENTFMEQYMDDYDQQILNAEVLSTENTGAQVVKEETAHAEKTFMQHYMDAYDQQTLSGEGELSSQATSYIAQFGLLKEQALALDASSETYEQDWQEISESNEAVLEAATEDWENGILTDDEYSEVVSAYRETTNALTGEDYSIEVLPAGSSSAIKTEQDYYSGDNYLAYDVVSPNDSDRGANDINHTYVASVKLGGVDVEQANSNNEWGRIVGYWGDTFEDNTGKKMSEYYGANLTYRNPAVEKTLVITPAEGYYITRVFIPCCNGGTPFDCSVMADGKAFDQSFSLATGKSVSVNISSKYFGHYNTDNYGSRQGRMQYFIMIEVAKIPTPMFVEYNYGNIVEYGADASVFNDADAWTTVTAGNNYGTTTKPDTNYTQYRYTYRFNPTDSKDWVHNANTVTAAAKEAAAKVGYYFAGWQAVYYGNCTESTNGAAAGNNYKYNFTNVLYNGATKDYAAGDKVDLISHVKLTAIWLPVQVKITKQVMGLEDDFLGSHSYGVTLYDGETVKSTHTLTVKDNGEESVYVNVVPGTSVYKIVETSGNGNLTVGNTTMYNTVSYEPETVSISVAEVVAGTYYKELKVTNTYSDAVPMLKLVKNWVDVDGKTPISADSNLLPDSVTFTVTFEDDTTKTYTLYKNNGYVLTADMPEKEIKSVAENPISGFVQAGDFAVTSEPDTDNQIIYTVYTATNRLDTTDVTITKDVSGNMGDIRKDFEFTVESDKALSVKGEFADYKVSDNGKTITFNLKDTESVTIAGVPIGAKLTVTETNASPYTVTITVGEDDYTNGAVIPVTNGMSISVNNHYDVSIDTGVFMDSFPFIMMFSVSAVMALIFILGKKRMMF